MTTPVNMVLYQCDKCHQQFDTIEQADACEASHSHFPLDEFKIVSTQGKDFTNHFPETITIQSLKIGVNATFQLKPQTYKKGL